ncbi:MAG: DUF4389 domain-containing protein [Solirubrobacteraceae bacterium]
MPAPTIRLHALHRGRRHGAPHVAAPELSEHLDRWKPLYKWFLAIPQYFVLAGLLIAVCLAILAGFLAVLLTGMYPEGIREFLVNAYRYALRVEAYVGFLTDRYPPFRLAA